MLRHLAGRALRQLGGGFSRLATPLQTASAVTAVASSHQLQLVKLLQGSAASWHGGGSSGPDEETIAVTFVEKDEEKTIRVPLGQSLLEAAHQNNIELEGAHLLRSACLTINRLQPPKFCNRPPSNHFAAQHRKPSALRLAASAY